MTIFEEAQKVVRERHPNMSDGFVELIAKDAVVFSAHILEEINHLESVRSKRAHIIKEEVRAARLEVFELEEAQKRVLGEQDRERLTKAAEGKAKRRAGRK